MAIEAADIKYGYMSLLKLIPPARMATISLLAASFEVKKITVMNTNRGLNIFIK